MTFNTGDTSKTLSVPTEGDFVVEADSTVTATVTAGTGYTVGSAASATATVKDDDSATFTVSAEPQTIDEGQTATLTVAISNSVTFAQDQTISLDLSASTATSASDFTVTPQSLTLSAGSNSVTASITAVDDTDDEGEETVAVSASHVGTAIGAAIVAITANDAAPLTAWFVGVPETHDGTAAFSFELYFSEEIDVSSATLLDLVIDVTGGSVTSVQRIAQGSTLGWMTRVRPASDGDMVLVLPVTTDCAAAGAICTASGKALSNRLQATVKGSPTVSISGGNTVVEGTPVGFTLVRTGTTDVALTVTVAVAETGSMLSGTPPTTAIFAAGADTAPLSVATSDDTVSEPSSTVTARVVAGIGYEVASSSSADATVTDDDVAEFSVSAHPGSVDEGGNSTVTVAISNGVTYVAAQTIMLTMAGTAASDDYTLSPPTLTLLAEASSATATFTAADDAVAEPEETVVVTATLDGVEIGSAALAINASAATSSGTPPVAAAGWDLTLAVDDVAYLDGSGSTGDVAMTWGWSFDSWPGGVMPHLNDPSAATPSFVPAETGTYVVRLTVSDGGGTASDTVMVTAVMTTEAASLMQADLWADANRDGRLDAADDAGEDTWSVSSGAIFVPNLDDDDGDEV
ncbi:MAG: hypothetical protein OXC31_24680, partial [Spirochaetaceae bacterium]|nr:hypothetical protein [Spirochaetaceae bacterium]